MKYLELLEKHLGNIGLQDIYNVLILEMKRIKVKDSNTINFWSSNLNGVYPIEYSIMEMNIIFYKLGIDKEELAEDILKTKGFNKNWEVSKDPFNVLLSMCYHKGIKMNNARGDELVFASYFILYFKMIAGRTRHYFSNYAQSEAVGRLAYDNMSDKYDLKRLGSQYKVMEKKFDMFKKGSKQYKQMTKPKGEYVVLVLNYMFSSINDYVKKGMSIAVEAEEQYSTSRGVTIITDAEGEDVAVVSGDSRYRETLQSLIMEDHAFYHSGLLELMGDTFNNFDRKLVIRTLEALHTESLKTKNVIPLIDAIVAGSFHYLHKEQVYPPFQKVLPKTVKVLRNYWAASKSKDENVQLAKTLLKNFVISKMGLTRVPTLANLSIVVPVYLFMLTVIKTDVRD